MLHAAWLESAKGVGLWNEMHVLLVWATGTESAVGSWSRGMVDLGDWGRVCGEREQSGIEVAK